jgi:hypothetical protein
VHNHVLRRLIRGPKKVPVSVLRGALDDARRRFGVLPDGESDAAADDVVVAVFRRGTPTAELTRRLREQLDA